MATSSTGAITFSGFNGIDFNTVINALVQQASTPLTNLQAQQQTLQNQKAAYTQLGTQVGNLENDTASLTSSTAFSQVNSTSSDTSVVTASAGVGALTGQYNIAVTNPATSQVTTSANGFSQPSTVVADSGSLSFTIGSTTTSAIQITSATTLSQLRDQINAQNSGVVASIVNTGSTNKLVLQSRSTGAANGFTVNSTLQNSGGTGIAFAAGQNATTGNVQNGQDAVLSVNNLSITSASNTITTAIPGITLNILNAGSASVGVSTSYTNLESSINSLVTDYNNLRSFAAGQQPNNGTSGPLANDTVLRQVTSDVNATLLQSNGSGQYQYLSQIGIQLDSSGNLTFDQQAFETAVNADPTDVQNLLQGSQGVFNTLTSHLQNLDATAGLIKTTQNSLDTQISSYNQQIADAQSRLDTYKATLQQEYAAAEQTMSQFQTEAGSLSAANNQNSSLSASIG
jgi:flagellar hook-associated protein 2